MAIKTDPMGLTILAAMLVMILAGIVLLLRQRRAGRVVFFVGFLLAAGAYAMRGLDLQTVPVRNLFDVFLGMGVLLWPISIFSRRVLGDERSEWIDALLAAAVLLPPALVFDPAPAQLPPALQHWLFIPHVAAYILADIVLIKATLLAVRQLGRPGSDEPARPMHGLILLGFPLLSAGLLLGAIWGKLAWGQYWNWDPKELWSLATWLIYAAYLHHRALAGTKQPRIAAALALAGGVAVVLTLLWVNLAPRLFAGLHSYS